MASIFRLHLCDYREHSKLVRVNGIALYRLREARETGLQCLVFLDSRILSGRVRYASRATGPRVVDCCLLRFTRALVCLHRRLGPVI
jgi:hypothetical protein